MASPSQSTPGPSPSVAAAGAGYFVDQKKGEVNELKQLLKNLNVERDVNKKRDVIKKVIAYMTLGIDVSRLFTDMIMAIETKDMVVKKMVYLYLTHYASKQPELAIMCINTLRRDCENEDPMVRGLALRSLCGLGMESVLEYVEQPLKKSFTDMSAYVRKTGVMGVLKIHNLSPDFIEDGGYLQTLEGLIQDVDASVVTNVLMVLEELRVAEGGVSPSKELMLQLLNRLGEFNEWGLNLVLDILSRYFPETEEETFAIMNVLDPVLRTSNSGAVLATIKCFMNLTEPYPDLLTQVIHRAKPPMLTLLTSGTSEIQYCILKHLEALLPRDIARGVFNDEHRQFFVRYNEPPHVKHLKIALLPLITCAENVREVASELGEYVTDVDAELSKRAICSMGEIAVRVSDVSGEMTQRLVELLELDMAYVRNEAMSVLGQVVRTYPSMRVHVLPNVARYLKKTEDSEARAVLVWLLGEFGDEIIEAPYLLERIIDDYEEEPSSTVKIHTLAAAMKLFFKRPPEMQAMLGRLLVSAVNDTTNQDVHDKALLYYRLLSTNVEKSALVFKRATDDSNSHVDGVANDRDSDELNQIFEEFNTLSVIYGKPCKVFIDEKYLLDMTTATINRQRRLEAIAAGEPMVPVAAPVIPATAVPGATATTNVGALANVDARVVAAPQQSVNLLDWDDEPSGPSSAPVALGQALCMQLVHCELAPTEFQQKWGTLREVLSDKICTLAMVPDATSEVESSMRAIQIQTMASGAQPSPPGMKFFLYAKEEEDILRNTGGGVFLVQMTIITASGDVSIVLKTSSTDPSSPSKFVAMLKKGLDEFSPGA